jgi:hypothetical protein
MKYFFILFIFATLIVVVVVNSTGNPLDLPRYDTSDIEYLGRFNLPSGGGSLAGGYHDGLLSTRQGCGGIAYNRANNSLIVAGSDVNNDGGSTVIAEVSIPTPRKSSPFNTAGFIQDYALACGSIGRQWQAVPGGGNGASITGLLVYDGKLLITVAGLYTNNDQPTCMFIRPSLNLKDNTVLGPYKVTGLSNQRMVGNGMGCELPPVWQPVFGGNRAIIGGGGNLSTMNTACYGPGFHFFNPDVIEGNTISGVNACYFSGINASGYPFAPGSESDVWNGMSTHRGTVVLPETRTFMAYGCGGSDAFYDVGGRITGESQGTKATGGTMNDRFWLYDARDLKAAFEGLKSPVNNIRPYATFDMNFCRHNTSLTWINELNQIRGLTFDPGNRVAYIYERSVGVHVVKFKGLAAGVSDLDQDRSEAEAAIHAYPNPFSTSVDISVSRTSHVARKEVELEVFNIAGNKVANIKSPATSDQRLATTWSPKTSPPGVYLIRAKVGNKVLTKQVTLIK